MSDVYVNFFLNGKRLAPKYEQLIGMIHNCTKKNPVKRRKIMKLYLKHCVLLSEEDAELEFRTEQDLVQFIDEASRICK